MASPIALCLIVVAALCGVALQGCGGGGSGDKTTPTTSSAPQTSPSPAPTTKSTTTTTKSTTTTTLHPRSPPLSPADTAAELNKLYMGFDEKDDESPLGVTISMAADQSSFHGNLFCAPEMNTKCFNGYADCRMSATIYNHKVVLKADQPNRPQMGIARQVGYVFNQTRVDTDFGKCAFVFDGASFARYNGGCGVGNGNNNCSSKQTAYDNICPSTGKTCTADDDEIKRVMCQPYGPMPVPTKGTDASCFFGMPAVNYPGKARANHLRDMLKARLQHQEGKDDKGPLISQWNEVILDEHVLIPAIRFDPARAISAFIYVKSLAGSRAAAEAMRDKFSEYYSVGKIPVLGVDDTVDFTTTGGPFVVEDAEAPSVTAV